MKAGWTQPDMSRGWQAEVPSVLTCWGFLHPGDVSFLAFSLYDEDIGSDNGKDEKMKEAIHIAGPMQQNWGLGTELN